MKSFFIILILSFSINSCKETKNIYVADHLTDCVGVTSQKCMLIKENVNDNWTSFYGNIKNFEYETGFEYLLKIKIETIKNSPADGSSLKYTLIKVLEKNKTKKKINLYNNWKVISMKGIDSFEKNPTIKFNNKEKSITGFAGCNNFFGKFDSERQNLSFSEMGMTRKMCPNMSLENTFINNLKNVSTYKIIDSKLQFFDKENQIIITSELTK